jgi:segregation and condensation protein B
MSGDGHQLLRMLEALLFAASEPLDAATLQSHLPAESDIDALLRELQAHYQGRGVNLVKRGDRWLFETAPDLSFLLRKDVEETVKLSRAGAETLAIIAYHQPATRAEIEQIRGVAVSKGTLDVLFEAGWISPKGRRRTPGRPVTYGTTDDFLVHFGLSALTDLPGIAELKAAGLMDAEPPADFHPQGNGETEDTSEDDEDEEDGSLFPLRSRTIPRS